MKFGTPLVSVVIPNYNGERYLTDCLVSIFNSTYKDLQVIVVDDCSSDFSCKYIRDNFREIHLVVNEVRSGFARTCNVGASIAKGDYILFLNNDTVLYPDSIEKLVKVMQSDPKIGLACCTSLLMDNPRVTERRSSWFTNFGFLYHEGILSYRKYTSNVEVFSPVFAAAMMRRDVFKHIGGFDDKFFVYFEDTDISWRVWLAGYKVVSVYDAIVLHKHGGTLSNSQLWLRQYHGFKNRIRALVKNLELNSLIKLLPVHIVLCLCIACMLAFKRLPLVSKAIVSALVWNLFNLQDTLRERKNIQRLRVIRDKDLFRRFSRQINLFTFRYHLKYVMEK